MNDPMPHPNRRSDVAYLDFVEGFRDFLLGPGANFEPRLDALLAQEKSRRGTPLEDVEQIRAFLEARPSMGLRNRLTRTQQEMKWQAIARSFDAQRAALAAELAAHDDRGPGRLELDPAFTMPAYAQVDFHLQPGSYWQDELSGFLYHYGTKVFFRGDNDRDELHAKLVERVPAPADGRVARVLDLACSVGQSTTAFKARFPQAEVTGIDYSAPMLRVAHRRAVMLGSDVTFAQRLIEATRYPAAQHDIVFAFIVFHELPLRIIHETVREAARLTRPGGVFAVYDFNDTAAQSPFQRYHRWWDARHNGEPYSQDFCDCDFDAILAEHGFVVAGAKLGQRAGGTGYMKHWFATRT
jgi:ubiquinone/menaquinone biosynthesis C-methylase UbiE